MLSTRVAAALVTLTVGLAAVGLWRLVDGAELRGGIVTGLGDPLGITIAAAAFFAAFALRSLAWIRVLPGLSFGQSLAALHVALGANHVLPLRLGEPLRVVSAVRRGGVDARDATATTVVLRSADVISLVVIGIVVGPVTVWALLGGWGVLALAVVVAAGSAGLIVVASRSERSPVRLPGPGAVLMVFGAWLLEAIVVWQVARWFPVELGPTEALLVLAVAVSAQIVAVAPGGFGTYEAAGAAARWPPSVSPRRPPSPSRSACTASRPPTAW